MEIEFVKADAAVSEKTAIAVLVFESEPLSGAASALDAAAGGALARAFSASRFTGAKGQILDVAGPSGTAAARILLVGAGKRDAWDDLAAEHAAASAYNAVKAAGQTILRLVSSDPGAERAARAALGVRSIAIAPRSRLKRSRRSSRPRW
jgi:leucyl aminopeptidase